MDMQIFSQKSDLNIITSAFYNIQRTHNTWHPTNNIGQDKPCLAWVSMCIFTLPMLCSLPFIITTLLHSPFKLMLHSQYIL